MGAAQRTTRHHALNSLFKDSLREATFKNLGSRYALDPTGIAGVAIIDFVGELLAREPHLIRIDDDDIVTAINVRGVAWLVLAAQNVGDDRSHTAHDQTIGIDQMPLLFDFSGLHRPRLTGDDLHGAVPSWFKLKTNTPPERAAWLKAPLMKGRQKVKKDAGFVTGKILPHLPNPNWRG